MKKICKNCKQEKPLTEFHKNNKQKDGRLNTCKNCYKLVFTKKPFTLETYPKRMYNNQRQNSKKLGRPYPKYSYEEFYEYLFKETNYKELYKVYEKSGFDKYLAPSTDRINPKGIYEFENIQIITWKENDLKGNINLENKEKYFEIIHYDLTGDKTIYKSIKEASKVLNVKKNHIYASCTYKLTKYPFGIFRYKNLGENRVKRLSKSLVKLINRKRKPNGNKGKMSPKQEAHLRKLQEMNRKDYQLRNI